jgi:hypothetical protein
MVISTISISKSDQSKKKLERGSPRRLKTALSSAVGPTTC